MNRRIVRLAAIAAIGSAALGLEVFAIDGVARGAQRLLGRPEAQALNRAGRIAAESLGRRAVERARAAAFDITLGIVRGLGAVYSATQSPVAAVPAVRHRVVEVRVLSSGGRAVVGVGAAPCCKAAPAPKDRGTIS